MKRKLLTLSIAALALINANAEDISPKTWDTLKIYRELRDLHLVGHALTPADYYVSYELELADWKGSITFGLSDLHSDWYGRVRCPAYVHLMHTMAGDLELVIRFTLADGFTDVIEPKEILEGDIKLDYRVIGRLVEQARAPTPETN